ncbi:unnamed protein product [Amoebophrya sp. A120]|nr:unnamed protein product [Amoebophrya sp. A120]|eukprot:GSA120T00001144001.1
MAATTRWEQQHDRDTGREPCPDRIVEDLGGAFGMGCVGGFLWHFVRGARNSPKGERLAGALYHGKSRAPILGGNFAVWGGCFATCDCTLQYIRRTDDSWNSIMSGFLTGGILAARAGWKQAGKNAVVGGVILTCIEGVSALLMRSYQKTPREQALEMIEYEKQYGPPPGTPGAEGGAAGGGTGMNMASMMSGMFGGQSAAGGGENNAADGGGEQSWFSQAISGASSSSSSDGNISTGDGTTTMMPAMDNGMQASSGASASSSFFPTESSLSFEGGLIPEGLSSAGAAAAHDSTTSSKPSGSWFRLPRR